VAADAVSSELPWNAAGEQLYYKNFKVFYVSEPDSVETTLFNTLDAGVIARKTSTIQVYAVNDAKLKPSNYDSVMDAVRNVKDTTEITGVVSRECDITVTFVADTMLTEFEFRFTETKIN